ncbi:unnamed protein product, partial [Ilex paraguariensis]
MGHVLELEGKVSKLTQNLEGKEKDVAAREKVTVKNFQESDNYQELIGGYYLAGYKAYRAETLMKFLNVDFSLLQLSSS